MNCIELSPKGHFEAWEADLKQELDSGDYEEGLGQKVLYEHHNIRLWSIILSPKERIGFRKIKSDFEVMSQVDGFAVSHRCTGEIALVQCKKGGTFRYDLNSFKEQIWDLENIGADPLELLVIEYLIDPE